MKLAILGASKGTGYQAVIKALDLGHEVTVILRNPNSFKLNHDRLTIRQGDVLNLSQLATAFSEQEAVLSTIGSATSRKPTTLYSDSIKNILAVMESQKVPRLVCVTSGGTHPGRDPNAPFWYEQIVKPLLLSNTYNDMKRMEKILMGSSIKWTIVRPAALTNKLPTSVYRTAEGYSLPKGIFISRADLADFTVKQLDSSEYLHKGVAIAY